MPRRPILACLFVLLALGLTGRTVDASPGDDSLSFLYTASKNYEPLAWMHGAERFSSGATVFIRDVHGQHALVADFAASADSAVSFDGQRVLFAGKQNAHDSWQVWEVALAGGKPRRITSGPEDCIRPLYLPEDRIVYARKAGGHFVVESAPLSGGKPLPLTYGPASALPTDVLRDGRILFESEFVSGSQTVPEIYTVYSDGSGVESYRCDHGKARHSGKQSGLGDIIFVSDGGLARFTSARAQQLPISAPAGEYAGEMAETAQGSWLLPWRSDGNSKFQLMFWTPGASNLRPELANAGLNLIQPVLLTQRAIPNRHPSGLHDWPNANLLCLNAYTSKDQFASGSIRSVRLYTRDDTGRASLLGTAPVEEDGSFFVQVPNEQALQIELLDSAGKTLKREAGYFWMRRGEQRVCVGCHAGPETAPENAVPMTLLKSTTPADMTGKATQSAAGGH